jgi:hypothetical protein
MTQDAQGTWDIDLHGWVHNPLVLTKVGQALVSLLQRRLELKADDLEVSVFRDRSRGFAVENIRKAQVHLRVGAHDIRVPKTKRNGHFKCNISMDNDQVQPFLHKNERGELLMPISARLNQSEVVTTGFVMAIPSHGISVISDLDDTIKYSNVADKKELLTNTFIRPLKPVDGMVKLYQTWAQEGAMFHYISASPWQLFGVVKEFLKESGFPPGSISLRKFALKDLTFLKKFFPSDKGKRKVIENLMSRCPVRNYVLVGDSGEKDPEMYGDVTRMYPEQVSRILIRNVTNEHPESPRFERAFTNIPRDKWQLFHDGETLLNEAR